MTTFGLLLGVATLFLIGLGFVWVIYVERYLGFLWWPYFMSMGALLVLASLFLRSDWASALMGAAGASFIWGSVELKEQAMRAELGWFPFRSEKIKPPFAKTISTWKAPRL